MGPLSTRKWLIVLLTSSFGVALCSWLYLQARGYLGWNTAKSNSPLLRAWLWMRAFLYTSTNLESDETLTSTRPEPRNSPPLAWNSDEAVSSSSFLAESSVSNLQGRRISGSPRIVVLSTRQVRNFSCSPFYSFENLLIGVFHCTITFSSIQLALLLKLIFNMHFSRSIALLIY
jgi:hypothetical protein